MTRCASTHEATGLYGIIARYANDAHTVVVRCRKDEGHDGDHIGPFQPFPGFADEQVVWHDPPPTTYTPLILVVDEATAARLHALAAPVVEALQAWPAERRAVFEANEWSDYALALGVVVRSLLVAVEET